MDVNERAPVVAASDTRVDAGVEATWGVLAAIERWPAWNPDVKWVGLSGPVAEGTEFRWKAGPSTITSRIERIERPRLLLWSGRTMGIRARHAWRLEPAGDGATAVSTEESWEGTVVRLLAPLLRPVLKRSLDSGLAHLKAEVERRRGSGPPAWSEAPRS